MVSRWPYGPRAKLESVSSKKRELTQPITLRGEGVRIATKHQQLIRGGAVVGAATLDFTGAQVPDRRFSADAGSVEVGSDVARILFAQANALGDKYEHLVVVKISFGGVYSFLRSMKEVAATGHDYIDKFKLSSPPAFDRQRAPSQSYALDANIIITGLHGRESVMDFYHASPHVMRALKSGGDFYAEPVVRVVLTTNLMMNIYDRLAEKKASMPADELEEFPDE